MARITKITNEQIIQAAREVFLEKGFGASTLEIAARVSISEASIFKRFATKEKLFLTAMGFPEVNPWIEQLNDISGKGCLKDNLTQICTQILQFSRAVMPRLMMLQARGVTFPECAKPGSRLSKDIHMLTAFLDQEIRLGRLRHCDSKTVAHMLLGSLMNFVFLENVEHKERTPSEISEFIHNFVETLWQAIRPD